MGDLELQDIAAAVIYLGCIAGALTAIAIVVRWTVLRPLKAWIMLQVKAPLIRIEQRLEDHIRNHPGAANERVRR